jgi:hypothetical protein
MIKAVDLGHLAGDETQRLFAQRLGRRRLMIGVSGAAAATTVLGGCTSQSPITAALDAGRLETVRKLCELLVPRTDTPGAVDAGCIAFVAARAAALPDDEQEGFLAGLGQIGALLARGAGSTWPRLATGADADDAAKAVLAVLRDWILLGYYTSEPGATQELRYEPVPGRYDPDVRVTPQTRSYSSDWMGVSLGGRR